MSRNLKGFARALRSATTLRNPCSTSERSVSPSRAAMRRT
jgi:hypothetical protein